MSEVQAKVNASSSGSLEPEASKVISSSSVKTSSSSGEAISAFGSRLTLKAPVFVMTHNLERVLGCINNDGVGL